MIADRRSMKHGLYRGLSLLTALAVLISARSVAAAPDLAAQTAGHGASRSTSTNSAGADRVPTRFEGFVKSISGNEWQINDFTVVRTPNTSVIEKRGAADVGAWVDVAGLRYDKHIEADVIEVLRPAGSPAPTYQYTGRLEKQGSTFWFVGDTLILVTPATVLNGDLTPGSLVRATVRRAGTEWEAQEITQFAPDVAKVPVAIEGVVQQVSDTSWIVDDTKVLVPQPVVPVDQGDVVEVSAVEENGVLVAQQVRRVDRTRQASLDGYVAEVQGLGEDNQNWTLTVFDGNQTTTQTVHVSPETYVDEDRATIGAGREARVEGEKVGATAVDAALIRLDQPVPATATGALVPARGSGVWLVGGQRVWFGSEQLKVRARAAAQLAASAADQAGATVRVHGVRLSNGVLVAQDVADAGPEVAPGLDGAAAALTASDGMGWRGPSFISPATAEASKPTLLFDAGGGGHAIFESLGAIYYSHQAPGGSWDAPRKISMGWTPTAVLDAQGLVHVAFRAEFLKNYDILHARQLRDGSWSLPVVVAQTTGASADPTLAADAGGKVYLAWMDLTSGSWSVQLGTWAGGYWTTYPVYYGQGQSPALAVMASGAVFLAWQDRLPGPGGTWGNYEVFAAERLGQEQFSTLPTIVSDNRTWRPGSDSIGVRVTATADGFVHLAWVDDKAQIRYLFGRTGYWPVPYSVGPRRALVRGVSLQQGSDGMLYLAVDEGETVSVISAPPRSQNWPEPLLLAARSAPTGPISDVSLTSSADRVAVTWIQANGSGSAGVYESQRLTVRQMLRWYIPGTLHQ